MRDLYSILGISKNSNKKQIKKAYHDKAKKSHPDAGGNEEEFKEIGLAYSILSDDHKRARYDQTGQTNKDSLELSYQKFIITALDRAFRNLYSLYKKTDPVIEIKNSLRVTLKKLQSDKVELDKQKKAYQKLVEKLIIEDNSNDFILDNLNALLEDFNRRSILKSEEIKEVQYFIKRLDQGVHFKQDEEEQNMQFGRIPYTVTINTNY